MQINEAKIFNFGKLQNKGYQFSEGINVIYGENEQGKSTLHAFLKGMLFGVEKTRGRVSGADLYSRYEPWHAPAFYSGALRFTVGGQPFYLERNFYNKEKSDYLRNEADGEELSVAYGDLSVLLGGIGREEFGNTYDIPQTGAATGKAMAELLTAYLAEAEAGGDGKVHVLKAQKNLSSRKRELTTEVKKLAAEREHMIQQKSIERDVLRDNAMELRGQIEEFEREQRELEEKLAGRKGRLKGGVRAALSVVLLMAAVVAGILGYYKFVPIEAAVVADMLMLIIGVLLWIPRKNEAEELLCHAKDMLSQIKEHLQEIENELINIEAEIEQLRKTPEDERELMEDIEALELAGAQIAKIAEEYYLEVADELNGEISKWISLLTNGTYDSARLDEDGMLWVVADNREVLPEALSRGTLEQIYLALRLAVGSVLMREEEMPIFLDEAFAMYDDVRLRETLKALDKTGKQVLIFTCQKRETAILQQEMIDYHEINLN